MAVPLQRLDEPPAHHLGIQPLEGQEQNAKIGGVGRVEILLPDILGKELDPPLQRRPRRFDERRIPAVVSILQLGVGVGRELGVNGQVHRPLVVPRQLDRELHEVLAARLGDHVGLVLLGRQNLLEDSSQLDFSENPPGLDVGQHLFQVAHPRR